MGSSRKAISIVLKRMVVKMNRFLEVPVFIPLPIGRVLITSLDLDSYYVR